MATAKKNEEKKVAKGIEKLPPDTRERPRHQK